MALVCLPWWIWAYSATGEVYLVDRLPVSWQLPIVMVSAILLSVAAGAYVSGIVVRFLADERRRRCTGWLVVVAWTVSLSGLLLATAAPALADLSIEDLRLYLADSWRPTSSSCPRTTACRRVRDLEGGSAERAVDALALALLFQVPVCLLVTVEGGLHANSSSPRRCCSAPWLRS